MTVRRAARPRTDLPNRRPELDSVNRAILTALAEDARLSMSELGRRVGMSAPAVRDRVGRLEETGAIRGYRADIDPAAVGLPVAVWVRIKPGPLQLEKIAALAERTPQVSECYRISGEDCFLMKVHVPSVMDIGALLDRFLPHGQTNSSIVVGTPIAARPPAG
jgi:Lrp/AsnC family leucine-responsive transcriptional regulator